MTSHSSSNRQWAAAHGALQDLLQDEFPDKPPGSRADRLQVFQDRAVLYMKYLQIFRSLGEVYEQLVQPQRRRAVRMVLDGLTGRLLELRSQMVELELSEFHYFDELLLDLKMTPDLEIPVPRYFLTDKIQLLRDRQTMFTNILETQRSNQKVSSVQSMSLEEAVRLLQVSERARQGRIRAQFMKELVQSERGVHRHTWRPPNLTPDQAAIRIQKVWRGHSQRNRTNAQRTDEMVFLGMIPAEPPGPSSAQLQARRVSVGRRLIQDQNEEEYQRAQLSVKQSVLDVEGTDIRETLQKQIRQWFLECRDAAGTFPEFPDVSAGGSASVFAQKTPEQVSAELAARDEREKKKKKQGGPEKKKKETAGKNKKKKKEQGDNSWMNPRSCFLSDVVDGDKTYSDVWRCRDDRQSVDVQLLREEKRQEVEQEVRLQVDELMRAELKNLKLVIDKTKTKKTKKGSRKKKKTKKKKRAKDLTADRSLQSLCEELILEGFLIQPMNIKLSDYIGEYSYLGSTLRQVNVEPMPSLSDVRQLIALYAVLPLGSQAVLERFPVVKTLLLAGPSGVGKKMLVHAVCSETGAHLFHLSPAHLSTRYRGRGGAAYLLHLIFKVAAELQPSVIWIEDAEKTFCKKTPKSEREVDPRRLKKNLLKSVKTLKPQDRVLVIGTTRRPFDADIKPFCKVYKKIILIPRPDYSSRLVLWRELLRAEGAEPGPHLDLSSLAKITDGFTQGHILQAVRSVLRPRRLKKLRLQPLTAAEFIQSLSRMEPVYREEEEAFKVWFRKTPLGRRKARAAKTNEEEGGGGGRKKKTTKEDKSKTMKKKTKKKKKN
ncbi:dynein regulatory complex protein 11 isoform X2 [Siniperca chuatsi]|uniref:dynein regulatory complex protein 11 isoform X2 n=1 Tax=Siniperca chuatsi TaxID=119488 RepID=UPI001CE1AC24|nr:dynein regulatory complex protein 11 isoform X2 [Siniperca chuatsi]